MVNPDEFMLRNVSDFKRRANQFNRKILYAILVYLPLFIVIFYELFINPPQTYLTALTAAICSLIFIVLVLIILEQKPTFKEYLLFYFWRGKYYLGKYQNEGADDKDLKKSISYFKQLDILLNEKFQSQSRFQFDTQAVINKSMIYLKKWVNKFVYKSLKKGKTDIYPQVEKVFNNSYNLIVDENFEALLNLLSPHVSKYFKKSQNPLLNFIVWLHSSYKRCVLFYGSLILIIIVIVIYSLFIAFGLEVVFGFFTIVSVVVFILALIISHLNKKFTSDK